MYIWGSNCDIEGPSRVVQSACLGVLSWPGRVAENIPGGGAWASQLRRTWCVRAKGPVRGSTRAMQPLGEESLNPFRCEHDERCCEGARTRKDTLRLRCPSPRQSGCNAPSSVCVCTLHVRMAPQRMLTEQGAMQTTQHEYCQSDTEPPPTRARVAPSRRRIPTPGSRYCRCRHGHCCFSGTRCSLGAPPHGTKEQESDSLAVRHFTDKYNLTNDGDASCRLVQASVTSLADVRPICPEALRQGGRQHTCESPEAATSLNIPFSWYSLVASSQIIKVCKTLGQGYTGTVVGSASGRAKQMVGVRLGYGRSGS